MWSQLFRAITSDKSYHRCKECGRWIEVSSDDAGSTVRRLYCSDLCRVRDYRKRRDRAVALAAEGKTPKQVAEQLGAEGRETDLATVKRWVGGTRKRGGGRRPRRGRD